MGTPGRPMTSRLPLFQMLQPCVQHFLDSVQFGAPHLAHVVKPSVKVRTEIAQTRIINQNAYEHSQRRNTDSDGRLDSSIAHHSYP